MGKKWKQWQILFSSAPKSLQTVTAATKLKTLLGRKAMTNLGSVSKNRDLLLPTKLCTVKALVFSVVMHRCEIWTIKKADTFKLWGWGRLLGVPWTAEIKPVNPKGNQSWIFIGRIDAEAETPILWPPDTKSWLIGKDPDVGKDWVQKEKGVTEDETVGWHHQYNGYECEQTLGDNEGQGRLACCCPWDHKESDTTEWLNNNNSFIESFLGSQNTVPAP